MSKVLVDRELLDRAVSIPTKESLEANQAAIIDRGRAQAEIRELLAQPAEADGVLAGRMRAAGMMTVEEMLAGAPLDGFIRHAGVKDLDTYGQWLDMKCREFLTMQAKRDLDKDPEDEMYEWVLAHAAVFQEARINFKAARDAHLAALSAVTAERDRLREEMAELWKRIDKFQSQSHGITALAEIERLRAEVEALRVALLGIASVNPAERGIEWAKSYASDGLKGAGSELYARWLDAFNEAEALRALLSKSFPVVEAHAGASHMLEGFRPTRNKWDELVDGIRAAMAAKEV